MTTPAPEDAGTVPEEVAPAVVAVVVTSDPGWWLEECLASLAAQDYPGLSVLVVDADSAEDPTGRVAAVMPGAYVRRVRRRRGFGTAANEVLSVVEGASHFVFCHDDVVLDQRAVRLMVEEAFRSNAGVIAPKLVGWFTPDRLLAVGMAADRFGVPVPLVERGELDQEQHDAVRDVFFAPSPCSLVRADLFSTLGGFDPGYGPLGEDLDLGWRAHLAGARVVAAPAAVVRHLEATESGQRMLGGGLRATGDDAEADAEAMALGWISAPAWAVDPGEGADADVVDAEAVWPGPGDSEWPALPEAPESGDPESGDPESGDPGSAGARHDSDVGAPWDLSAWDQPESMSVDAERLAAASAHHATRRARREAERDQNDDTWSGDSGGWEVAVRPSRHGRRLRGALAGSPREAALGTATATAPAVAPLRGPDADALDDARVDARLRAVASDYGRIRAVMHLAALLMVTGAEVLVLVWTHQRDRVAGVVRPWSVILRQSGAIRRRRAAAHRIRRVPDRDIASLHNGGSARLLYALRDPLTRDDAPGRSWVDGRRLTVMAWVAAVVVLVYGSRHLITGTLPTLGGIAPWPALGVLARTATSGWRATGLGTAAAAPTAFALMTIAGVVMLGHTTVLQHVVVLGLLPVGLIGVARLSRPFESRRATVVALIAYLIVPLPYDALASGRWSGLVAYALLPWLLLVLLRVTGLTPFDEVPPVLGRPRLFTTTARRIAGLALLLAVAGAFEPSLLVIAVLTGLALALGTALAGPWRSGIRAAFVAAAAAVGAVVLLLPWSWEWLPPNGEWATFSRSAATGQALRLPSLLRFDTGPIGGGLPGYALLVAAALPLVVGRDWRAGWAIRLWTVALAFFGLAWAAQHGALGIGWPPAEVMLAPAAVALALSAGLGMAAFDVDLAGFNFGWRQAASGIAAAAAVIACLPVLAASINGRWDQPSTGFDAVLSWLPPKRVDGDFRVLWIGRPGVLPIAGWRLADGLDYATSVDGAPDVTDSWPGTSRGATRLLGQAVTLVREGSTTEVGHLLAPMGVRYVILVNLPAPLDESASGLVPPPLDLAAGLDSQTDIEQVDRSTAMTVYQNDAWAPIVSLVGDEGVVAAGRLDDPRLARTANLGATAQPVLGDVHPPTSFGGVVPSGSSIELAEAPSSHWHLSPHGSSGSRVGVFGSANLFSTTGGGKGSIHYDTPIFWQLALLIQVGLWGLAVHVSFGRRRRVARPPRAEAGPPPEPARELVEVGV